MYTVLGLVGAGIRVGMDWDNEPKPTVARITTTFVAGAAFAGAGSTAAVSYLGFGPGLSGIAALVIGVMVMGYLEKLRKGELKLPGLDKLTGGAP